MKDKLYIIGLSKTSIHLCKFVQEYELFDVKGFAVDREYKDVETFLDLPVYAIDELEKIIDKEKDFLFVAIFWNNLNSDRRNVYERLKNQGYRFANVISPTSKVRGRINGDNCWLHDYTIMQNDSEIGTNVHIMAFSLIGAHSVVGSHCFVGAKSVVGGGCSVGEQSFVGINSTIFDDTIVGKKCIVGASTNVKRNVPDYSLCKTTTSNTETIQFEENTIEAKLSFKKNVR